MLIVKSAAGRNMQHVPRHRRDGYNGFNTKEICNLSVTRLLLGLALSL